MALLLPENEEEYLREREREREREGAEDYQTLNSPSFVLLACYCVYHSKGGFAEMGGDSPVSQTGAACPSGSSCSSSVSPSMEQLLGLLRVRVVKGLNLAVRDLSTSDPYIVLKMGKQKLKTHVVKKNINPEWNEDLTFSIAEPIMPIKLEVFDKDTFSQDDRMGDAEINILPFVEAVKMNLEGTRSGTVLNKLVPSRQNCLAEESRILWLEGKVVQDVCLRLRNVECGEVELQFQWISLPGRRAF